MKKNYLMMMAMLLFAAIGFTGCSDDDDNDIDGDAKTLLVGTWELTHVVGFESDPNGETDEWSDDVDGYYITFYEDGTIEEEGYKAIWSVSGNSLVITDPDDGDVEVYTIRTLTATTLVLYLCENEGGYYLEETRTYTKR